MAKKEYSKEELQDMLKELEREEKATKKATKRKKMVRMEFSKIIIVAVFVLCTRWIELTYHLAMADKEQIAEQLAIAIVTTLLGSITAYSFKSFGEKNSRNKYGFEVKKEKIEDEIGEV